MALGGCIAQQFAPVFDQRGRVEQSNDRTIEQSQSRTAAFVGPFELITVSRFLK
jgi:hypothetical protein